MKNVPSECLDKLSQGSAQDFLSGGLTWTKVNVMCAGK